MAEQGLLTRWWQNRSGSSLVASALLSWLSAGMIPHHSGKRELGSLSSASD